MIVPFLSVPLFLMLTGAGEVVTMLSFFGSMIIFAFFFGIMVMKHNRFKDQQESYRRKSSKNVVFYKWNDDGEWYSIYLNGSGGEGESDRKLWRYIKNDSAFQKFGTWEMGGSTDEWEKRQKREKRLKKILKK